MENSDNWEWVGMDKAQHECEHEQMGTIGRAPGNFRKRWMSAGQV